MNTFEFGEGVYSADDFFSPFNGGIFSHMRSGRGESMIYRMPVTLEDLYTGRTVDLPLSRKVVCRSCKGVGGKNPRECDLCKGRGVINRQHLIMKCPSCKGEGSTFGDRDRCKKCNGEKVVEEKQNVQVCIKPGMRDGERILMRGLANEQPGVDTGDLIVVLETCDHPIFEREGDNLRLKKKISLSEALFGVKMVVKHLDGGKISLFSKPGDILEPGCVRGVFNRGMPKVQNPSNYGILFVTFVVEFPEDHFLKSKEQYDLLEKLLEGRPPEPTIPTGEDVEEVTLMPYEEQRYRKRRTAREAYHVDGEHDDDDDDEMEGGGAQSVPCAQQ